MPKFSQSSINRLNTCHPDLQRLFLEVVKVRDCSIVEGYRTKEEQDKAFYAGRSQVKWPNGMHNKFPSQAVDVWPYPVPRLENGLIDDNSFVWDQFANEVFEKAAELGIEVVWGGSWDTLVDKPHWELKTK